MLTFAGVFVGMHTQLSTHICMLHGGACVKEGLCVNVSI